MSWRSGAAAWLVVLVLAGVGYAAVRTARPELVDFTVVRTAAERYLGSEPLYRPSDGHYQFKYLPAFAAVMAPFAWLPKVVSELLWFTLLMAMAWMLIRWSIDALPERRLSWTLLAWLAVLLNAKSLIKELAFGQFNLPLAMLLLAALIAIQQRRASWAGALIAAGVFVKPYALVMLPWLVWTQGWRPLIPFGAVVAAGLALPAMSYGWQGNINLLQEWFRTVSQTTAPNLLFRENISFASMWAKWIGAGFVASSLAMLSCVAAVGAGWLATRRRGLVAEPAFLEASFFFVLIPLLSPQGWDYVLLLALPAYVCLVDRWSETSPAWRAVAMTGFVLTSFAFYDFMRRTLYFLLMDYGATTVGAVLLAACLIRLRWRALA